MAILAFLFLQILFIDFFIYKKFQTKKQFGIASNIKLVFVV
nr:MAG TPA: hypothetical protein [Caudoviricetes sp.]